MIRFIITLVALVPSIALADFYKPDQVPASIRPAGYPRGRSAALQIEGSTRGCSATVISSQGHVITALHCLPECYKQVKDKTVSSFRFIAPRVDQIAAGKSSCNISFKQEGRSLGTLSSQVVAAGAGYVEVSNAAELQKEIDGSAVKRDYFVRVMQAGVGISGDFIILRVPKLASRTCAQVVNRVVNKGESIWDISYPVRSRRANGLSAPGGEAVFSSGNVSWILNGPANYNVQKGSEAVALRMNRPGIMINSIDSNEGSSGAGLLTPSGELLGVLNASGVRIADMASSFQANAYIGKDGKPVHTNGSRYAVSADMIRRQVGAVYGAAVASSAFSCY